MSLPEVCPTYYSSIAGFHESWELLSRKPRLLEQGISNAVGYTEWHLKGIHKDS